MIKYNELSDTKYEELRLQLIKGTEALSTIIYIDSVGIPTIGAGMNLQEKDPRNAVLNSLFGHDIPLDSTLATEDGYRRRIENEIFSVEKLETKGKTKQQIEQDKIRIAADLQGKIDLIMQERSGKTTSSFTFNDDAEIILTFGNLAQTYEDIVDNAFPNLSIPKSMERLTLFSLAYNGGGGAISTNLRSAINSGNRPEAWYQIRYQLNGGSSKGPGIAKRRYIESSIFGLYNDGENVDETEAKSVFATLSKEDHQKIIKNYEAKYRNYPATRKVNGVVVHYERDMLAEANAENNLIATVSSYEDAIAQAKYVLTHLYAPNIVIDQILVDSTANLLSDKTTTATNTLMFGESGEDTYSFSSMSGIDEIVDTNNNGKIQIRKTLISGNALPKNDPSGNEIPNSWMLADIGYDLTQSGNDLVITKAGSDIASSNKVIIKDFPFSKDKAFGITLGKVRDGSDLVTKTFTNPYFPEDWIFPTKDGKGFFGIGYGTDTTFGPDKIIMFVAKFDELGNETGRQLFDYNLPSGQGRVQATDGNHILVVFNSRNTLNSIDYSTAGIALVDYSGNIAASQVVDSTDSTIAIKRSISGGSVLTKDDPNYYYYYYTTSREPQGDIIVVKLNKVTLEKEGDPIYYSLSQMGKMYEDYGTPIFTAFKPDFTLSDGTRIMFKNSQYLTAEVPKYRDMRPDEITPNYDLASGFQTTNSQLRQFVFFFRMNPKNHL